MKVIRFFIATYMIVLIVLFFTGFWIEDYLEFIGKKNRMAPKKPLFFGWTAKGLFKFVRAWLTDFFTEYDFELVFLCFFFWDPWLGFFFFYIVGAFVLYDLFREFWEWAKFEVITFEYTDLVSYGYSDEEIKARKLLIPEEMPEHLKDKEIIEEVKNEIPENERPLPPGVVRRPG